ncbi:MAG: carboxypeptidase-like regulatory domain-containing protein [Cyclobacteriaceae bacterium]|nr:carboxypeptidase-like regulatory domain-containing protein [Cyclobacteriaceae bacterium]
MKTALQVSVPKPCSELWENFQHNDQGGLCKSCNKYVIDFTKLDDDAVLNLLQTNSTKICGRLRADQLKIYTLQPTLKIHPSFTLLKAGFLSIFMLLSAKPALSVPSQQKHQTMALDESTTAHVLPGDNDYKIKGIVVDEFGDPLPGVNVVLMGSGIGTSTDAEGKFEFPQKLNEGDVLVFSFIGFQSKELKIRKDENSVVEIRMKMTLDIMGEVSISEVYSSQSSGLQRLLLRIKSIF